MSNKCSLEINLVITPADAKHIKSSLEIAKITLDKEYKQRRNSNQDTGSLSTSAHKLKLLADNISQQVWEAEDTHKKGFFMPTRPWFTWKSVRLENRNKLPESSGVYVVASLWRPFYVGRSQNLRMRWSGSSHHRYDQAIKIFMPRIYYITLPLVNITRTEEHTIEKLNPVWNWSPALHKKYAEASRSLRQKLNFLEFGLIGVILTVLLKTT